MDHEDGGCEVLGVTLEVPTGAIVGREWTFRLHNAGH
jgi:hypothetical protein